MRTKRIWYLWIAVSLLLGSCGKEFLDVKRNANQVVPHTVKDYLAIISHNNMISSSNAYCFFGSDEYYLLPNALNSAVSSSPYLRQVYIWGDDVYGSEIDHRDWNAAYEVVMYCNLALEVEKLSPSENEVEDWNRARLAARFHRAWSFYQLAQMFCPVYDQQTASKQIGLPLRLDYDLSMRYQRSTLQDTYDQILKDLHEAASISAPPDQNIFTPDAVAVKALLARIYLQMGFYAEAGIYAAQVLQEHKQLLDFNTLSGTITNEGGSYFPAYSAGHPEVLFYMNRAPGALVSTTRFNASDAYLESFDENDLRRKIFFFTRANGTKAFIGSYSGRGGNNLFSGLAIDEMLLIRAECAARQGREREALEDINYLRKHRYRSGTHDDLQLGEVEDVLRLVLEERRKELYMRGLRWEDARRLNREGKYPVTFVRVLEDETYLLEPDSKKWIWPIPPNEIANNHLLQNER